jgi:Uma2 family endonuclease
MSTAAVEVPPDGEGLLRAWREMDVPAGWRAEIIFAASITVTPPPSPAHNYIADLVDEMLRPVLPAGAGVYQTLGVRIPSISRAYIPDMVVVPREALLTSEPEVGSEHVLLAVEITSKDNADHDRKAKRWGYAHGHVPLYLLIDRWARPNPSVTLFSEPEKGDYRRDVRVPFGEKIKLPEPFDLEVDTSDFPAGT